MLLQLLFLPSSMHTYYYLLQLITTYYCFQVPITVYYCFNILIIIHTKKTCPQPLVKRLSHRPRCRTIYLNTSHRLEIKLINSSCSNSRTKRRPSPALMANSSCVSPAFFLSVFIPVGVYYLLPLLIYRPIYSEIFIILSQISCSWIY